MLVEKLGQFYTTYACGMCGLRCHVIGDRVIWRNHEKPQRRGKFSQKTRKEKRI